MVKSIHRVSVVVNRIDHLDSEVRTYHLTDVDHWPLPPFSAGAHVDVHLPSGSIRQYSLCGDPSVSTAYQIAVQKDATGRGGSIELHDQISVGDPLLLSLPRNTFPIDTVSPLVMVAGGIGITPFLSTLHTLGESDRPWHLHYCAGSADKAPFADHLATLLPDTSYTLHFSDDGSRLDIENLITTLDDETHLYCCGPARMISACENYADQLGDRLHIEHFGLNTNADPAYEVALAKTGRIITVAEGQTMLQALRAAGVETPASCEGGVCLECKCRWTAGSPLHRDLTMPAADRNQWITPCVSGSAGDRITLDI